MPDTRPEVALHLRPEWTRVTLASIGDAVITTDTEGRVTFLNPVAQSLTGWTQDEAAGVSVETVFKIVHPETRIIVESPAVRALREGVNVGLTNRTLLIAKDGKVDEKAGTFNYFLLYDEVVNTEKIITDGSGKMVKKTSDSVMTSRNEEKADRPLMGVIISTGDGQIMPMKQALKEFSGKLVIFCDDFDGLHPTYRKMLAKDTWIIEIEKPGGLREAKKSVK